MGKVIIVHLKPWLDIAFLGFIGTTVIVLADAVEKALLS